MAYIFWINAWFSSDSGQFSNEARGNNRRNDFEDRPITPLTRSYKQVAEEYGDDDGDDSQYYNNRSNDRSPARDNERTLPSQRVMSASQRSTMNSMSRTFDPRYPTKYQQQTKNISPAKTMGSMTREKSSLDDGKSSLYRICKIKSFYILVGTTLRDNPNHDAYGPMAKDIKINTLRTYVMVLFFYWIIFIW